MRKSGFLGSATAWTASVLLLMVLVDGAHASAFSSESASSEAPSGISIRGVGVARSEADAIPRAVSDAKERARLIASTLGVQLGRIEGIDQEETGALGLNRRCSSPAIQGEPCREPAAAEVLVTFQIDGIMALAGVSRSARAIGLGSASVEPANRTRNKSIKVAVLSARRAATREAAVLIRRNATAAAHAAGLRPGSVISVSEVQQPSLFGLPVFRDTAGGTLGPGQFCGVTNRIVRATVGGKPKLIRRPRHRCLAPSRYDVNLEIRVEMLPRTATTSGHDIEY